MATASAPTAAREDLGVGAERTQHVIDAIDGALADEEWPDAMRWSPDPEAVT